jgi:hypothetical protein
MEAASTCETSVHLFQTTRRNNPEDGHLHTRRRENLKSHYWKSSRCTSRHQIPCFKVTKICATSQYKQLSSGEWRQHKTRSAAKLATVYYWLRAARWEREGDWNLPWTWVCNLIGGTTTSEITKRPCRGWSWMSVNCNWNPKNEAHR